MENFKQLLEKIENLKKEGKVDLSSEEDLSLAVMNLISLEEHLFFTGAKTDKEKYYEMIEKVRDIRQDLLKKLINKTEGESWCIAKHLLAASMRLIEVGTKYQSQGDKKNAKDFFNKAWSLYSLFWGIRLGLVKIKDLPNTNGTTDKERDSLELSELLKKLVDCCH